MIKKYKHIDLCTPIDKIEFGQGNDIRIHNAFRFYEIETVLDLCKMSRNAFLRIRSCGVRTIRAIETTLADYGLELEMDEKSIEEYQRYHSFVLTDSEWEERRYEIAKEIYLNKFSDFSKESAELALMAADDFIGVLKKHYQNKD